MATFQRFEEIDAWRLARELTRSIYSLSSQGEFARDFALRDQIRRSAISMMANIAEGYERDGTKEFIQFLSLAKASAGEVRSHLYVALDQHYIDQVQFTSQVENLMRISGKIRALMNTLRASQYKGTKYKSGE